MNAMIANGKLVNTDAALTYVLGDADGFRDFLKSNGLSAGKKPVADLFAGARDEVAGFYFVADDVSEVVDEVESVESAPVVDAEPAAAPTAGDADEKPAFVPEAVDAAVAEFLAAGGEVVTSKPAEPAAAPSAKVKTAKVLKAVSPAGKVKPVRRGTKIANGLELLLAGTSASQLVGAGYCDDVVDFCNRRVTKRGYGIALVAADPGAEEVIRLVLPAGVTAVAYSG